MIDLFGAQGAKKGHPVSEICADVGDEFSQFESGLSIVPELKCGTLDFELLILKLRDLLASSQGLWHGLAVVPFEHGLVVEKF